MQLLAATPVQNGFPPAGRQAGTQGSVNQMMAQSSEGATTTGPSREAEQTAACISFPLRAENSYKWNFLLKNGPEKGTPQEVEKCRAGYMKLL